MGHGIKISRGGIKTAVNADIVNTIVAEKIDYATLWRGTEKFIKMMARKYFIAHNPRHCEVEDLIQSGFLALVDASESFNADCGYSFLTWLAFYLKKRFNECAGYRTAGDRFFNRCASLNERVGEDEDCEIVDLIPDERATFEEVEQKIYIEQLRKALDDALSEIPEEQAVSIRSHYLDGETYKEIASKKHKSVTAVDFEIKRGLNKLRKYSITGKGRVLRDYLDDRTYFYATGSHGSRPTEGIVIHREAIENHYIKKAGVH